MNICSVCGSKLTQGNKYSDTLCWYCKFGDTDCNYVTKSKKLDLTDVPQIERKDYIIIKSESVFKEEKDDKNG